MPGTSVPSFDSSALGIGCQACDGLLKYCYNEMHLISSVFLHKAVVTRSVISNLKKKSHGTH